MAGYRTAWGLLLWSYVLTDLENDRRARQAELERQVDAYARSYAIRVRRSVVDTDRLLLLLRHNWMVSGRHLDLAGTIEAGIFSRQYIAGAGLIDRKGVIVTSSHPDAVGWNFSDKPYFTEQQRSSGDRLYVSAPLEGRLSRREVIAFSRPLLSPRGAFDGIVLVSVFPAFFTQHYAEPLLGQHGFAAVTGRDGVIRACRHGNVEHTANQPFLLKPLSPAMAEGVARLEGRPWFTDGRARVVGWQPIPGIGLTALVGVDEYSAMAPYRRHRAAALNGAWWNTAWLTLAALLATSFYVHAKCKQHQLDTIRATYRLATEDAGEGFFIHRPLRDRRGVVRDFEILDCNHHGANMFGMEPSQLIGRRLSDFYEGRILEDIYARLNEALETGLYESEIEVTPRPGQLLKASWVHY